MNQEDTIYVKTINPSFDNLENPVEIDMFENEGKTLISISHPQDYSIGTISESLGFAQSNEHTWSLSIDKTYGSNKDYFIDICKVLIKLGFSVVIKNKQLFDSIKSIDFQNREIVYGYKRHKQFISY